MDFFLGIQLPKEFEETCESYRRAFKAPKTITHITVVPPFTWQGASEKLKELLEKSLARVGPFQLSGDGIGSFGTKVLFISVNLTPELSALQQTVAGSLEQAGIAMDTRPYNPHITLATRLDALQFAAYKAKLGDFSPTYSFTCSHLSIFHITAAKRWQEWCTLPL